MNNRRKFMSVTGLAVAGIGIGGVRGPLLMSHESRAEREVFRVVAGYGSQESVTRSSGLGTVTIKVRMHSAEALAETFTNMGSLPFERVHALGNTLCFQHRGTEFLLENLI